MNGCDHLHVCPNFGDCNRKDCNFPHNLSSDNNQRIIKESNCENIDPLLIIRLIQHYQKLMYNLSEVITFIFLNQSKFRL